MEKARDHNLPNDMKQQLEANNEHIKIPKGTLKREIRKTTRT